MKISEIREMSVEDIDKKIKETKRELLDLRFKKASGTLDKPSDIKKAKKLIARLMTVKSEKTGGDN